MKKRKHREFQFVVPSICEIQRSLFEKFAYESDNDLAILSGMLSCAAERSTRTEVSRRLGRLETDCRLLC